MDFSDSNKGHYEYLLQCIIYYYILKSPETLPFAHDLVNLSFSKFNNVIPQLRNVTLLPLLDGPGLNWAFLHLFNSIAVFRNPTQSIISKYQALNFIPKICTLCETYKKKVTYRFLGYCVCKLSQSKTTDDQSNAYQEIINFINTLKDYKDIIDVSENQKSSLKPHHILIASFFKPMNQVYNYDSKGWIKFLECLGAENVHKSDKHRKVSDRFIEYLKKENIDILFIKQRKGVALQFDKTKTKLFANNNKQLIQEKIISKL